MLANACAPRKAGYFRECAKAQRGNHDQSRKTQTCRPRIRRLLDLRPMGGAWRRDAGTTDQIVHLAPSMKPGRDPLSTPIGEHLPSETLTAAAA